MLAIVDEMNRVLRKAVLLHSEAAIETALDSMAKEMTRELAHENPLLLCVMNGGIVPMGRLLTRLHFPLELDYIHATRYQGKTTAGELEWRVVPRRSLQNRTVVLVDDILDGGLTLQAIVDYCKEQGANAIYSAVLVTKDRTRPPAGLQKADFVGVAVDDVYVFGYGLDYQEYWRNAPGIYTIG
jgi:hypoxanthine phosphoribosyltransferase